MYMITLIVRLRHFSLSPYYKLQRNIYIYIYSIFLIVFVSFFFVFHNFLVTFKYDRMIMLP